jgi:L-ascorbate metabolism protein UlaG (beta-lactamase superfamily)
MGHPNHVPTPKAWDSNGITAAWLGHATVLINFYGVNIITDPVLFKRVGASTRFGAIGPKRLIAAALRPSELPPIDLVVLSHAHMDHLDPISLRTLKGNPKAVTAYATADLLRRTPLDQPIPMAWGDHARVKTTHGEVEVKAFQVQHWGARWRWDNHRGYNGYVLTREGKSIIFGGDTAWSESFRGLKRSGPYEVAIMPIGAYDPHIRSHCTPEEAVTMANHANASYFLPIHYRTFPLGQEGPVQPVERLMETIENERIGWTDIGQTFSRA